MRRRLGDLLGLLCLGLARCLLLALAGGGHRGLGRLFAPGLLRRCRRRDFLHLVVLEWRDLGGLRRGLVLQGTAALLVHLREVVGLLRRLVALEGGQGDFQGLADLARRGHGEAHPEDEGDVQDGCDEQGEAQTVRRADAGSGGGGLEDGGVHCGSWWLAWGEVCRWGAEKSMTHSAPWTRGRSPWRIGRAEAGGPRPARAIQRAASWAAMASISLSPMRVSKAWSISRMQVGLVTLISVR